MKGEKIRVVIIYFLVLVLIGLVWYLVYFINNQNNPKQKQEKTVTETTKDEITSACTFDVTLEEFNKLNSDQTIELCEENKLNISDIVINDNVIDIYAIYYNGSESKDKLGIYINDNQIIKGASKKDKNTITVNDNLLFIKKESSKNTNLLVFNENGQNIYSLNDVLTASKLEDPVLTELAKTDENITKEVTIDNIDMNSLTFEQGAFTFTTIVKGTEQKGSTYKVTYEEEVFSNPTLVTQ